MWFVKKIAASEMRIKWLKTKGNPDFLRFYLFYIFDDLLKLGKANIWLTLSNENG